MITFVSAFYILESKFAKEKYIKWMSNFLPNICNFKFVIFTDKNTRFIFDEYKKNPNIKIVLVEIEDFHNYKYKKYWIKNHLRNTLLNCNKKIANGMQCHKTDWKLNMLWSEKIEFVRKASENKYFPETEWYGWCDIGYFRGNSAGDISEIQIKQWPNNDKLKKMNKNKVYYALVRRDKKYINNLIELINNKNSNGLPINPIPRDQWSIAGGFFVTHKENVNWWFEMYDKKLQLYFENNYLVKDDQIIIVDNIFSNLNKFSIIEEYNGNPWFAFQRYLL